MHCIIMRACLSSNSDDLFTRYSQCWLQPESASGQINLLRVTILNCYIILSMYSMLLKPDTASIYQCSCLGQHIHNRNAFLTHLQRFIYISYLWWWESINWVYQYLQEGNAILVRQLAIGLLVHLREIKSMAINPSQYYNRQDVCLPEVEMAGRCKYTISWLVNIDSRIHCTTVGKEHEMHGRMLVLVLQL